jgi:cell division protease FtsH
LRASIKNVVFWAVAAGAAFAIWSVVKSSPGGQVITLTFTQFSQEIDHGNVREVTITGSDFAGIFRVRGVLKQGNASFKTAAPANYTDWLKALSEKNVTIVFDDSGRTGWMTWTLNALPMVLLLGLWIFFMRQMNRAGRQKTPAASGKAESSQAAHY